MVIVETSIFTRQILVLLSDDEYRLLQESVAARPDQGVLLRGGGGARKVRWGASGTGKRGGCRIIYYWFVAADQIIFLLAYGKNEKDDLSRDEVKELRDLVKEQFK